jgi:hypothetical protein
MGHHQVRLHKWVNGALQSVTHFFEDLEAAKNFANTSDSHAVKVYTNEGELVHSAASPGAQELKTYA